MPPRPKFTVCDMQMQLPIRLFTLQARQGTIMDLPTHWYDQATAALPRPQRWLVRLPNVEDTMKRCSTRRNHNGSGTSQTGCCAQTSPYFAGRRVPAAGR
jgi:hypothetical protein